MKITLTGLPQSGKTTVFNALTRQQVAVGAYSGGLAEPNMAIVNVEDERVDRLKAFYSPKSTVYATVEIADLPPMAKDEEKSGIDDGMLRVMKISNALALVLRNFESPLEGAPTPLEDLGKINETLIFSDLLLADTRLERIAAMIKKGQKTPQLIVEQQALEGIHAHLEAGKPIRELSLSDVQLTAIRGFQFLTEKPIMVILNSGEETFGKNSSLLEQISNLYPALEFAGTFEMELSQLHDEAEAKAFMADMGITRSARERLTVAAYELLGYISFFTVGSDEVRAWSIRRGATALDAAGAIHSDLARGFIRAECFHYAELMELGSEKAVQEKGRLRLEGKNYLVKDGDILSIRFNV